MIDELQQQLDALARDDCYRVDAVLKETEFERTERVFFVGANGAEQGPYVRKTFAAQAGMGGAYKRIVAAQRAGARFAHLPHIVDCYEAGENEVVVMEWLPGRTLADEVYACDASLSLAARLFPQACDAVRELHERFDPPIIHRDVKPSNFMVLGNTVMLIDLGISRTFDAKASTDTRHFGTRAYAPPEQFGYRQTDKRSDVYALGMLLFYLLCEEVPDPATLDERMWAHGVPLELRNIVRKATTFDPANRYQSVTGLQDAFEEFQHNQVQYSHNAAFQGSSTVKAERGSYLAPVDVSSVSATTSEQLPDDWTLNFRLLGRRLSRVANKVSARVSRVPVGVGIAWDTVLVLNVVLMAVICVNSAFHPVGSTEQLPFAACAATYASVWIMLLSLVVIVLDVGPFYKQIPRLTKLRMRTRIGIAVCLFVASFAVIAAIGMIFFKS